MMNEKKSVLRNSVFILAARGMNIASSFFILIAVARYLPVEGYGEYSYITAFVSSIMALTYFGIQQVLIREIAKDKVNSHHYLGSAIILRTGLSFIASSALVAIIMFSKQSAMLTYAALIAICSEFFLTQGMLMKSVFQAYEKTIYEPIISALYCIFMSAGIGATIYFDLGLLWLFIAAAVSNAAQFAMSCYVVFTRFVRPSFLIDRKIFIMMLKHSSVIGLGIFFYQNLFRIDILMLKWLGSPKEVAFFQASHGLIMQIEVLPAAFIAALFPVFSRLVADDPDRVASVFRKSFRYILIAGALSSVYLFLFSKEIIDIVFGARYSPSVPSLMIMAWAVGPLSLDMLLNSVLTVMNLQRYSVIYGGITLLLNFIAALLFIPTYGFVAAACISLSSYFALFGFSLYFVAKNGLPLVGKDVILETIFICLVSAAAVMIIKPHSPLMAAVFGPAVSIAVFLATSSIAVDLFALTGKRKEFLQRGENLDG